MRTKRLRGAAALLLVLAACGTPPKLFVEAERATYDAIAPEYRAYVAADQSLTELEKQRRQNTLSRWDESLAAQEARIR